MPYHIEMDKIRESVEDRIKIGTTKKGIGPCYADKISRDGIRMADLLDLKQFEEKLRANLKEKNEIFTKIYGIEPLDFDTIFEEYKGYIEQIKHRIVDTIPIVNKALDENKLVLFEGAQAMMTRHQLWNLSLCYFIISYTWRSYNRSRCFTKKNRQRYWCNESLYNKSWRRTFCNRT